jgi:cell division transport system permease protein
MKLVGATDSFIQRPFLYTGFWYGLLGGLMAWITVALILLWVDASLQHFMQLYQMNFDITDMDSNMIFTMLGTSVALGLVGSALSVRRHVKEIEPT